MKSFLLCFFIFLITIVNASADNTFIIGTNDGGPLPVYSDIVLGYNSDCFFELEGDRQFTSFRWELRVFQEDTDETYTYATSDFDIFMFTAGDLPGGYGDYNWLIQRLPPVDAYVWFPKGYIMAKIIFTGIKNGTDTVTLERDVFLDLLPEIPVLEVRQVLAIENSYAVKYQFEASKTDFFTVTELTFDGTRNMVGGMAGDSITATTFSSSAQGFHITAWNKYGAVDSKSIFVQEFLKSSSLAELNEPDLRIYPNPVRDYINIDGGDLPDHARISITDLQGKRHLQTELEGNVIDVRQLPDGIYILNMKMKDGSPLYRKFIKRSLF